MMFLWIPMLLIVLFLLLWGSRGGSSKASCCEAHNGHEHATVGTPRPSSDGPSPIEIARLRLARGEITPEQFEGISKTLS